MPLAIFLSLWGGVEDVGFVLVLIRFGLNWIGFNFNYLFLKKTLTTMWLFHLPVNTLRLRWRNYGSVWLVVNRLRCASTWLQAWFLKSAEGVPCAFKVVPFSRVIRSS